MRPRPYLIILVLALSGCAHTVLSKDGKPIADFQGNMKNVVYSNADIRFTADEINHSDATLAQGSSASGKITSTGTALAALAYAVKYIIKFFP